MNGRDEELLSAYYDGELPDEERARAEQLLTDDVAAREVLDEVAEVSGWIRELPRTAAPAGLHDDVLARIRTSAAALPLKSAPARSSWRRWAGWTAASAAGLLIAAFLFRNELTPEADRRAGKMVAMRDSEVSAETPSLVAAQSDFVSTRHSLAVSAAPMEPPAVDLVQMANSNSLQFQDQLAELLKNGQTPVPGEEFTNLVQIGDRVVVIKYRIVDIEKLPGEVQLVLTNNGIVEVPGAKTGLATFAYADRAEQLDAFYVEAPETNFTSAITDITNLNGVTAVTENSFVATVAAPASGGEPDVALSERFLSFELTDGVAPAAVPPDPPLPSAAFAPLSVSGSAPAVSEESKAVSEAGATASFGAVTEGRVASSEAAPRADAYQVAVSAQKELVAELQEQELLFSNADRDVNQPVSSAPSQQGARRMFNNRSWGLQTNQAQGRPAAPNRVRAVILLVPEQPE